MATVNVEPTEDFQKQAFQLSKKYRSLPDVIENLIEQLETGEHPGDKIPGVGHDTYKVRLPNPDANKGKSGGFRVIYYVKVADKIMLLTIYPKSKKENISPTEIRRIINQLKK